MTQCKHTPGPWVILPEQNTGRVGQFCILTENGPRLDIASTYGWPNTPIEANARLIASAPDLLAALVGMLDGFKLTQKPEHYPADHPCNMAIRAIRKATVDTTAEALAAIDDAIAASA